MSQIGHTLFTKTGDDHDQLKQKMLSVWKVLVEEYWKNEQHQVKVPVKSLHWSDYAISFHPQTYNSNIVECGIFHPIQGLFSTDSKRLPIHSFMGVPALSTHRLAKLEVCRASSWIFRLCLYHGMAPERFISPLWTHFRLTTRGWQMSGSGVFKKAVSAICLKIDDELTGKNKIRYPNTRHRILKGNTNSGIPETFSFGVRNPGLWNPEFSSRNPESRIQAPLTRIQNRQRGIWNPRLSWITLHWRKTKIWKRK